LGSGTLNGPIFDWPGLKALALSLDLPEVTEAHPWGHEVLKAHGKMWCYWGAMADGAVFRADKAERDMLLDADPQTFFLHPHYAPHNLILVRPGRIDPDWARARLVRHWRELAPKRWLKDWDRAQGGG
jgi:hypothetical protein